MEGLQAWRDEVRKFRRFAHRSAEPAVQNESLWAVKVINNCQRLRGNRCSSAAGLSLRALTQDADLREY